MRTYEKIRFYTFDKQNYGSMYHLGDREVLVYTEVEQHSRKLGCCSEELVKEELKTILLEGRSFVVRPIAPWNASSGCKYEVSIPYGFKPKLLFPTLTCPYCGK